MPEQTINLTLKDFTEMKNDIHLLKNSQKQTCKKIDKITDKLDEISQLISANKKQPEVCENMFSEKFATKDDVKKIGVENNNMINGIIEEISFRDLDKKDNKKKIIEILMEYQKENYNQEEVKKQRSREAIRTKFYIVSVTITVITAIVSLLVNLIGG